MSARGATDTSAALSLKIRTAASIKPVKREKYCNLLRTRDSEMGGNVVVVKSKEEWQSYQSKGGESKPVVVDFTATWCGPCRMISPYFEELSTEFSGLVFLKVDVDDMEEIAAECGVSAMPTFQIWRGGEKVEELVGASKERLRDIVQKFSKP